MAKRTDTAEIAEMPTVQSETAEQSAQTDPRDALIARLTKQLDDLTGQVQEIKDSQDKAPSFAAEVRKLDEMDGYCLFNYKHDANPERHMSQNILRLPIYVDGPEPTKKGEERQRLIDYLALVPGIQAIPTEQAKQLLDSEFDVVKGLIADGVIELWAKDWQLTAMEPTQAIKTIALTNRSNKLLAAWAKSYHDLSDVVKRRLVAKQEELNAKSMEGPKTLFGTSIS